MIEENGLTRRQALATMGATFLGGNVYQNTSKEVVLLLSQTKELGDLAEEKRSEREYGIERMKEYVEKNLRERSYGTNIPELEITYTDSEPSIRNNDVKKALREWKNVSGSKSKSHLLITEKSFLPEAVGRGEVASNSYDKTVSILGEGYDLLNIEKNDVKEEILVSEYVGKSGREPVYNPHITALSGLHEIGHNLGLDHSNGHVITEGTPNFRDVYTSLMGYSYTEEIAEKQGIELRHTDDIYWDTRFSPESIQKLEKMF